METIYFGLIIFLFLLAIFDLWVGVSNDAVNFLNSAIGAKAGSFRLIIIIASIGVFCGAAMSNGMMEIARHGIFQPQYFYFSELMCIMLAVLVTDVVLLDVFNSLGMPTSTTVSLVFELLGGTVALALFKSASDGGVPFAQMLNTDKAFSVILGIFLSVAIAFFFGAFVQWLARLLFTFNYKRRLKWFAGIFGGVAITAIVYFMLIKGIKDLSFMTAENKMWVHDNTCGIVLCCLAGFSILMQLLYTLKINVFKIIVLFGTFALAMAFAGNDLVNFIGVPLAGYSSYLDYMANGQGVGVDNYLMGALNSPASTPIYFLLITGVVMVISLITSKKAQNVVKTSLKLSRQDEGEEMFGSSPLARKIVHGSMAFSNTIQKMTPVKVRTWIDKRFNKDDAILADGASFDLIRASVNLVLAGLLVALGTSLKLPLSTTYVTFMVAMGSSLADRAWGRESAVFRITGVISVIGGWFITAGVAFIMCFIVATAMHFGGIVVMIALVALSIFILIRSNIKYNKKMQNEKDDTTFREMMSTKDKNKIWSLLQLHVSDSVPEAIEFSADAYLQITKSFIEENRKGLHKIVGVIKEQRDKYKKIKRRELLGLQRVEPAIAITRNTWFHWLNNNSEQLMYCLKRMSEPCMEHLDNNFNPLPQECISEFLPIRDKLVELMDKTRRIFVSGDFENMNDIVYQIDQLRITISTTMDMHAHRIQDSMNRDNMNIYMIYMNMLQESGQLAATLKQLIRAACKFLAKL